VHYQSFTYIYTSVDASRAATGTARLLTMSNAFQNRGITHAALLAQSLLTLLVCMTGMAVRAINLSGKYPCIMVTCCDVIVSERVTIESRVMQ
jgi:hypothetical protein